MPEEVEFEKDTHTYRLNGKVIPSVTQVLSKVGISPDYATVDEETLKAAAERGTEIHREISEWATRGYISFSNELTSFIEWVNKNGIEILASEKTVWTEEMAGTLDLIVRQGDDVILYDIKTTATPYMKSTSWQTSAYAYLLARCQSDIWPNKVGMLWFDKYGAIHPYELFFHGDMEIRKMIQCYREGKQMAEDLDLPSAIQHQLIQASASIAFYDSQLKKARDRAKKLYDSIKEKMENAGIISWESPDGQLKLTVRRGYQTEVIDRKALKADCPEIYEKYARPSEVKSSLLVTSRTPESKEEK